MHVNNWEVESVHELRFFDRSKLIVSSLLVDKTLMISSEQDRRFISCADNWLDHFGHLAEPGLRWKPK